MPWEGSEAGGRPDGQKHEDGNDVTTATSLSAQVYGTCRNVQCSIDPANVIDLSSSVLLGIDLF